MCADYSLIHFHLSKFRFVDLFFFFHYSAGGSVCQGILQKIARRADTRHLGCLLCLVCIEFPDTSPYSSLFVLFCKRTYKRNEIEVRRNKRNVLSVRQTGICRFKTSILSSLIKMLLLSDIRNSLQ